MNKEDEREILNILLDETKATRKAAQDTAEKVAGMEVALDRLTNMTAKLDHAVYGNGAPGLRTQTDMLRQRIDLLESHGVDDLKAKIDAIVLRHEEEDRDKEAEREEQKKEGDRARNYKWSMITVVSVMALDFLARIFGLDVNLLAYVKEIFN